MARSVLVVDDKSHYLQAFVKSHRPFFEGLALEVATCTSVAEAKKYLARYGGDVVLVVADIKLPSPRKGTELLSFVKEKFPAIKKVVTTGIAPRGVVGQLGAQGLVDGYFEKKATDREIQHEIQRVLEAPADSAAHSRITEAVRLWLKQHPEAKGTEIKFIDQEKAMTVEDVVKEIERGTRFGREQENLIYQLAWELWRKKQGSGASTGA